MVVHFNNWIISTNLKVFAHGSVIHKARDIYYFGGEGGGFIPGMI